MSQRTTGLRALLSSAAVYASFQDLLGAPAFRRRLVAEFLGVAPGMRMLDIGCGTADLLGHVPAGVEYHGFDLSDRYVAAARRRWGARGQFWQASVGDAPRLTAGRFQRAVAIGVLHHVDDTEAAQLAAQAAAALTDDGMLVTYDPTIIAATSRVARLLIQNDRGRHVRSPDAYAALLRRHFAEVSVTEIAGHLRIPYTACVITARRPRR